MADETLSVSLDGAEVLTVRTNAMITAMRDMRPFAPAFKDAFVKGEALQFATSGSFGGHSWAGLAPATIARKGHSRILVDTGAMLKAFTTPEVYRVGSGTVQLGVSSIPYAVYHQTGTANMPARPPLATGGGMPSEFEKAVAKMARAFGLMWSGGTVADLGGAK